MNVITETGRHNHSLWFSLYIGIRFFYSDACVVSDEPQKEFYKKTARPCCQERA